MKIDKIVIKKIKLTGSTSSTEAASLENDIKKFKEDNFDVIDIKVNPNADQSEAVITFILQKIKPD